MKKVLQVTYDNPKNVKNVYSFLHMRIVVVHVQQAAQSSYLEIMDCQWIDTTAVRHILGPISNAYS
jgi:hypothetical protein